MPADNSSVKTASASTAPTTTTGAGSVEEHDRLLAKEMFDMEANPTGVKEAEETVSPGAATQDEDESESKETPETPDKNGTLDSEETEDAETAGTETETETETEDVAEEDKPKPGDTPRAQDRIRQLAKEKADLKKQLQDKEARLLKISRGEIQAPAATANGTSAANKPIASHEPSSREIRKFISDLRAAQSNGSQVNGQDVSSADIEWAEVELQKQVHREVMREESTRASQARAAQTAREWVVKKAMSLEARDPRFSLLDENGNVSDTPFSKAVETLVKQNGGKTPQDVILAAYEVADAVRNGELELAQTKAAQAATQTRKVIQRTSLASPAQARGGAAGSKPSSKTAAKSGAQELGDWIAGK